MQRLRIFQARLFVPLALVFLMVMSSPHVGAAPTPDAPAGPAWAEPATISLRSLGTGAATGTPRLSFEDNFECIHVNHRVNGDGLPQLGCYEPTAFGSVDVRNDLMSFGVDEDTVVPLFPYGPHDVLLPWPGTTSMLAVTPTATDGAYLSLYRDVLASTADRRNFLGQVTAKQVTKGADLPLLDPHGRKLIVNFNSLAFSDGGSWLVVESLSGLFFRINLATLEAKPFAPSYANLSAGFNESQVAVSEDGNFVAVANSAAKSLRVYDLAHCPGLAVDSTICPSHDYWAYISAQAKDFQHPVHVRFMHAGLLSFTNVVSSGETTYQLAPAATGFALMDYLAIGDSYAAGEGAFAYKPGTDTAANDCHNSTKSYPALLTGDLFTSLGGNSVGCSGARIHDILPSPSYAGQMAGGIPFSRRSTNQLQQLFNSYVPGNLPQASFVGHYQPAAMTVTVGGNDVGFADIMKLCVAPHVNPHVTNANACYNTYEDRLEIAKLIESQVSRLTNLFKRLQAVSPGSTIYAVGYPLIAVDNGSCALNVHLNTSELAFSIEVTKQLNSAIARAATAAAVNYVDIENALAGHRLCEIRSDQVAVNGLTAGSDGGIAASIAGHAVTIDFLGQESYHPNAYGYQLIEQAVLRQTHNLRLKTPVPAASPPATTPGSKLLQAPRSNRAVARKIPAPLAPNKSALRGGDLRIKLPGAEYGLRPSKPHSVKISAGGRVTAVGTITSDAAANLDGTITVPASTAPGSYEIGVSGEDQLGNPVTMIDVITIINSSVDYDGDGILNTVDSCPTIANSGVDADHDGTDDACDNFIGTGANSGGGAVVGSPVTSSPPLTAPPAVPAANSAGNIAPDPVIISPMPAGFDLTVNPLEPPIESVSQKFGPILQASFEMPARKTKQVSGNAINGQPVVLGAAVNKGVQLTKNEIHPASSNETVGRQKLRTLPLIWLALLYVACLCIFWLTKRARLQPGSLWRRKRDSNPRYP